MGIKLLSFIVGLCVASTAIAHDEHKDEHKHEHRVIVLDGQENAPSVKMTVKKDAMSGWNVHVITENFKFAPENANKTHVAGEGHAHLYVDGKKVARLYGPWFHLPPMGTGEHKLRVSLNSNQHDSFSLNGQPLEDTITLIE